MDVALIVAAYNGVKFARDSLKAALDFKIENETRERINTVLEKLGSVQDSLFQLREELFRLQAENERLRQELKSREDWETQKAAYKLETTVGGAVVYAFSGTPKHYACPSCLTKKMMQILQDLGVASGEFECPGCKTIYPVKVSQPIKVEY